MVTKKLDKTTLQIVFYFIERLNGVLGKTHLQKMLFLTDLLSAQKFKDKLTDIEYRKYHYGPYSEAINDYTKDLENRGFIEVREFSFSDNSPRTYSRFYKKASGSSKSSLISDLGVEKVMLLDDVIGSYGNMSLQNVLDVVYKLELVKGTEKNKPLDIAKEVVSHSDEPVEGAISVA